MLKNSLLKVKQKPAVAFAGQYRMVKRNAHTHEVVRDTGWFDNIILDTGLNRLGANSGVSVIDRCVIGTGTTAPAAGDSSLAAFAAVTTTLAAGVPSPSNSGSPDYITTNTYGYRFNAGTLNGNYTEVGVGWGTTSLWSRALILDGGGTPTTISIGPTEYLDVFYQVRTVPDLTIYTTTVVIGGVSYSVQRKPAGVNNTNTWKFANTPFSIFVVLSGVTSNPVQTYTGTLGAVTGVPSGTLSVAAVVSPALDAYANNSFERTATCTIGLDSCNAVGGIKSLVAGTNMCGYQLEFDTVVPKDNTKVMTLSGKVTWGRL